MLVIIIKTFHGYNIDSSHSNYYGTEAECNAGHYDSLFAEYPSSVKVTSY